MRVWFHASRARFEALGRSARSKLWYPSIVLAVCVCVGCTHKKLYYPDGLKRSEGDRSWFGNVEVGLWTYWYPNGELREQGRYDNGRRAGIWTQWFPNGQKRSQGERRHDDATLGSEREGAWTHWHENGEKQSSGVYRAGKAEGHWDHGLDNGGVDGDRTGEYHDNLKID